MTNINYSDAEDITFNSASQTTDFLLEENTLRTYIQQIVSHYLKKYDNNIVLVAQKLDIGKSTIYRMLKNGEIELN